MNKGFTVIELMVVTGIIVVLTGLLLPNWKSGQKQFALQRSSHKLAQDIRRAQEMALAAEKFGGQVPYGYGVYARQSEPDHYIIFADLNNNQDYDAGTDGIVEDISIEKYSSIGLLSADPLRVVFVPPDPQVIIRPAGPGFIRLVAGERTLEVCVNNLGLIEVASTCFRNNPPVAVSCLVSPATVGAGANTTFTLSGQATDADGDGTIVAWVWDWGDGNEVTAMLNPTNQQHAYSLPAGETTYAYYPKLRVIDDQSASSGNVPCNPITVNEAAGGNLVGYAWSENVGWIDFCPTNQSSPGAVAPAGTHSACGELAGAELRGWAKVVSSGGWISLNCADVPGCTSGYKVTYNSATGKFGGFAWSEDFGWICFDSASCP